MGTNGNAVGAKNLSPAGTGTNGKYLRADNAHDVTRLGITEKGVFIAFDGNASAGFIHLPDAEFIALVQDWLKHKGV